MNSHASIYDTSLDANDANYVALSPLSFAERTARIYPELTAIVYEDRRLSWGETFERMRR
ncbi:acyl-CoA synthetase, partial [Escherichia coli]|nr:acyl-CoA synthetase [Escherichia coli]